jgi:hypothetical protein
MMKRVLLVMLAAAAAACGHFGMGGSSGANALIVFHNESLDQANVYIIAPGADWVRIGTVFGGRTDTLVVRNSLIATGSGVNVVARILASSALPQSGNIPLQPGGVFDLRLSPDHRTLSATPGRP